MLKGNENTLACYFGYRNCAFQPAVFVVCVCVYDVGVGVGGGVFVVVVDSLCDASE